MRPSPALEWEDLDLAAFGSSPLDQDSLRCLRYMHDVEFHTVCYLRDLLLTPAHTDPELTAFLSTWVYEELWHGEALAAVLEAHGEEHGQLRVAALRGGLGWRDRLRPLLAALGGWWAGDDLVALLMAWGALNESTTQAGYSLLARRAGHPVLQELVGRIMRQEGRHLDFYTRQAARRLAVSRRARRLTRAALSMLWRPVGSGVLPAAESTFLLRHLMGGPDGQTAVERLDRRLDRLPGLSDLRLVRRAVARAGVRPAPGPV
ncbi:MAG: ferritin-like domain-containing protein [Actinomycetota bacterium]|jgi:hypothetical protein|nr:ferritin-like domain-containing protein [Actinomycetota bacterium]